MHRFHTIMLVASILFCPLIHTARAQPAPTSAANAIRWNGLNVTRFANAYQSIIGQPGTQMIPESDTASSLGLNLPVTLPFTVNMFGTSFAGGSSAYLGIGGYLCFNPSATKSTSSYLLYPDPDYKWVVAPYWSDLRTTGLTGQGIFHRFQVSPSGDSTWTIEWSVETIAPPRSSGRFQLQMVKHPAPGPAAIPWLEVMFHYDPSTTLARTVPQGLGAQIGLKNIGQPIGVPPSSTASGTDDSLYLLVTPESLPPSLPGGPSITRLPTQVAGGFNVPDWTATATSPASSYFHYEMPDSSCKLKPIDTDTPPTLGAPPPVADAFGYGFIQFTGEATAIPVGVVNEGYLPAYDVPVRVKVYSGLALIDGAVASVDSVLPGDTAWVTCTVGGLAPGAYRVVAITSNPEDHFRANDSVSRRLIIRATTDVMPFSIDSPRLGPGEPYAQTGAPVAITGGVGGTGTSRATRVYYSYSVRDMEGTEVASGLDSSDTQLPDTSEVIGIPFGTWTPTEPGHYTISIKATAEGDQITSNDLLAGAPSIDGFVRGGLTTPLTLAPVPLLVFDQRDPAVAAPGAYPFLPVEGDSVTDSTLVMATIVNNGASDEANLTLHVRIENGMGTPVYDEQVQVNDLAGGGGIRGVLFPWFVPTASGTYEAQAWIDNVPGDAVTTNNTVSWQFDVALGGLGKRSVGTSGAAGWRVSPNPARDVVTVTLDGAVRGGGRFVLSDLLGAQVRVVPVGDGAAGPIGIDLAGLPAGVYTLRLQRADGTGSTIPVMVRR